MLKVVYCPRNDDNNFLTLATSETEWSLKEWKRKFFWYSSEVEYMVSLILTYIYSILQWCIICSRVQKKPLGSIWMFHQLWVASFMVTMKTCCQGPISTGTTRTLLKCSLSLKSHNLNNSKEFVNTLSYPLNWVPRFVQLKKRQHETDFRTCQWCSNNFNKTDITLSMDDSWPGRPKARGACGQSLCFLQWTGALWKGELVH